MRTILKVLLFLPILLLTQTSQLTAQDPGQQSPEMQAWMNYMTPGWAQEMLAKGTGQWKCEIKSWMDPSGEPMISEGSAVSEMILGGRYLQTTFSSTVMGMPMNGMGLDAYDNAKKVFVSTWIDNMGTGIAYMEGTYDEAAKTITYHGKTTDPMTGKDMKMKTVITFMNEKEQKMEMFMEYEGKEIKNMEMLYTRM